VDADVLALGARGEIRTPGKVITAVARELVGFIWAVGTTTEAAFANAEAG
jgi:hypothetical protein